MFGNVWYAARSVVTPQGTLFHNVGTKVAPPVQPQHQPVNEWLQYSAHVQSSPWGNVPASALSSVFGGFRV